MNAKILIADDDYDNRTIIKQVLEASGYLVLEAANGQQAIDLAVSEKPDLIFMDLSMPKLNGWEAAKLLKADPRTAGIRICAFTAHALDGDESKARSCGCDDYISKPCVPREVAEKVNGWLKKKEV